AVKQSFEKLTGLPIDVLPAIDVARYFPAKRVGSAPNCPLVITVSNSGKVSRVKEAIQRMNKLGALTMGLTSGKTTPLGEVCQKVIDTSVPSFENAPGVRGYLASLEALLLLAIRLGEVRGRYTMDQANLYRKDIKNCAGKIAETIEPIDQKVYEIAKRWKDFGGFDFVASGLDYASAWYGHAKMIEAAGKYAMHINTEEWLHLNFFLKDVNTTGTILVVDDENTAMSRTKEALHYMQIMKRPLMLITDTEGLEVPDEFCIIVPKTDFEITSPFMFFIPMALLAGYIGILNGEPYSRGFKDNWAFAEDASAIWTSEIEIIQ
ncbi:MAG: sugar isomerase, partial [Hungatella sp.]